MNPTAPSGMLRRDRRRAQEAAAAAEAAAQQAMAAVAVGIAQASASAGIAHETQTVDEPVPAEIVAGSAEPVAVAEPVAAAHVDPLFPDAAASAEGTVVGAPASDVDTPGQDLTDLDADASDEADALSDEVTAEPSAETSTNARTPRFSRARRPRRRGAAASVGSGPASASTPPVGGRRKLRVGKSTIAAFAIATLVGGTALPALGLAQSGLGTASAASAGLSVDAQSFTASSDVMPNVLVSGEFSATTPSELADIRASAAATAKSGIAPIANPGQVIIPMAEGTYEMTDGFGAARPGRSHMGQDYAAPIGTPIYAAADGVVTMSQDSYNGYGVTVQVQHVIDGKAVTTLYGHMNYDSRGVEVGDTVVAGQYLGRVGTTGYTIGSCLHFEVRINGTQINPIPWLEANVR
ncbi:M23 family metallopeptidase [Microbacterium sp. ZW T5_45]|uniref:M23 family metallopeptidase n=1 Tax=Microbacterium sp. ZW T5_45 TaxID=3378080 RepID=UPI003851D29A